MAPGAERIYSLLVEIVDDPQIHVGRRRYEMIDIIESGMQHEVRQVRRRGLRVEIGVELGLVE